MGTVITTIEVGDPQGRNFQTVEVEVDTGSTYTALPREMLQTLEVPVDTSVQSRLADGSLQEVEIGQATIRLGRRQFSTTGTLDKLKPPNWRKTQKESFAIF